MSGKGTIFFPYFCSEGGNAGGDVGILFSADGFF